MARDHADREPRLGVRNVALPRGGVASEAPTVVDRPTKTSSVPE